MGEGASSAAARRAPSAAAEAKDGVAWEGPSSGKASLRASRCSPWRALVSKGPEGPKKLLNVVVAAMLLEAWLFCCEEKSNDDPKCRLC